MNKYPPDSNKQTKEYTDLMDDMRIHKYDSNYLMIPIEINAKDNSFGLFVFDNLSLPVGGQKHLSEITGLLSPELAGTKVFYSKILPSMQKNYENALHKLADSIDRWDRSIHSDETSLWALRIADRMGLPMEQIKVIKVAAKLHDIGKAIVPREILIKPGPLTSDEWKIIRRHPGYSATLMEPAKSLDVVRPIVHAHHEHFDGGGYPDKLSGDTIPIGARIISVADAFSTMTVRRVYRKPVSMEDAKKELIRCSGTQFDPQVVSIMLQILSSA
ncbi:MAG: HD domain-containing protein [Anaerolineaceae bacterium]|nr:HD domain-containing protein [Anaerolineaceae bacterium]